MTDYMLKHTISDIIRFIFATIDRVVYMLMEVLYSIFFTVATADLLGGEMIRSMYYRVQLILGVFMIFKLAVTILQGIMNPDLVYDKKQGVGKIISRIVVSLIMLALITPINVPNPSNEWEQQLNNNGLLFGSLFSLQNRILSNNTIGRLILGTTDTATDPASPDNLLETSRTFASTILKTFVRINVLPKLQEDPGDGRDPATLKANRVCKNFNNKILQTYTNPKASPNEILSLVNLGCGRAENGTNAATLFNEEVQEFLGNEYYAFFYLPILGAIVGIIIDFVLIAYSIDVAIRVFKLAILRLIAPIPIISHMSMDASKEAKGADSFSLWTKSLVSTYIELFIRLAIIYFVLFVIQGLMAKGPSGLFLGLKFGSVWYVNMFAFVFVIIGLMLFAKQAPKYIQSVLGMQSAGGSVGLTAFATILGNLRGGTKIGDIRTLGDNVSEAVAERNFGDKSKGHGQFYNAKKSTIDKVFSDYGRDLQQEYYKRGLDIDDYSYNLYDRASGDNKKVIGSVEGLDRSHYKKAFYEDTKSKKGRDLTTSLTNNQQRYKARMSAYDPSDGRGVTERSGQINQNASYSVPPQYRYRDSNGLTNRYSDMPKEGSTTPPPDSSKTPPSPPSPPSPPTP